MEQIFFKILAFVMLAVIPFVVSKNFDKETSFKGRNFRILNTVAGIVGCVVYLYCSKAGGSLLTNCDLYFCGLFLLITAGLFFVKDSWFSLSMVESSKKIIEFLSVKETKTEQELSLLCDMKILIRKNFVIVLLFCSFYVILFISLARILAYLI